MQTATEVCENCGAGIGQLETPMVWQEHVVCSACHAKLSSDPAGMSRSHDLGTAAPDSLARPRGRRVRRRRPSALATIGKLVALLVAVAIVLGIGLQSADNADAMRRLLSVVAVIAVVIWVISFAMRSALKARDGGAGE